ncbi:875_t:CDS:2, partial [Scutellospora calospora]
ETSKTDSSDDDKFNDDEFNDDKFNNAEFNNDKFNNNKFNDNRFNNEEDSNAEVSIIEVEEANNAITKLFNSEISESDFEIELTEVYNIKFPENLDDTIKQLEKEVKSNKHSKIEKAHLYAMLSYFYLDDDILMQIKSFLRSNKWNVNLYELAIHVNEVRKEVYIDGKNIEEETHPAWYYETIILVIHNKCQGKSVYVSKFLTDVSGHLVLYDEDKAAFSNLPTEACIIIYLSKDDNKWWNSDDLINQVKNYTILIFEAQFSDTKALFVFDNATNHCAYTKDALLAKNINLSP